MNMNTIEEKRLAPVASELNEKVDKQEPQAQDDSLMATPSTPPLPQEEEAAVVQAAPSDSPRQVEAKVHAAQHTVLVDLGVDPEDVIAPEEEPLRDEEVFGDVVGYGFSDEEMQRYFRDKEWQPGWQQPKKNLLLTPEQAQQKDAYWKKLLTGDVSTIPNHIRQKILGKAEVLSEEEQDYQLYGAINRSWAVDYLGMERERVQSAWPQYRKRLAKRLDVADKDEDVFLALSERESEKPLRAAGEAVYAVAYAAGVEGKRAYHIEELLKNLSPEHADNAKGLAVRAYEEGAAERRRLMPLARLIRDGMESFTAVDEDSLPAIRVLENAPALTGAIREMSSMTRQERQVALHVARSIMPTPQPGEDDDPNMLTTIQSLFRRSAANGGMNFAQGMAQLSSAGMRLLGRSSGKPGKLMKNWAEKVDKYSIIFEELRRFAQNELHPLQPSASSGWAGQLLVDMCSAVPELITSFVKSPVAGVILNVRDVGQSTMDVRMRAPEAEADVALTAGALGMLIQRQVEGAISKIGGDKLGSAISRLLKTRGGGMKRFVMHGAGVSNALAVELVRELIAGKIGQGAGLLTQDAVMKCKQTASNIDWQQFGKNAVDVNMTMREAAAELPFILLGAGRVALRDFTAPRSLLKNEAEALIPWGIPEAERKKIAAEPDIDKQGEMLRKALNESPRWGGMDFAERAARALHLLNFKYFTEFKDRDFVCDFLNLPPLDAYTAKSDTPHAEAEASPQVVPPAIFRVQTHADAEYQRQMMELWNEEWVKAHYEDFASHLELPEWEIGRAVTPSQKRLVHYMDEIFKSPYEPLPRRLRRDGLYAPFAEIERKWLLRDRVADVKNISHLLALHSLSLDSLSETRVPISEMRRNAEEARQAYLGKIVGSVLRIRNGEDASKVLHETETDILKDLHDRLYNLDNKPMWFFGLPHRAFKSLPKLELDEYNYISLRNWFKDPEMLEIYRICVGTRTNIRLMADLLPLTDDYFTAISRGMTPLQACNHLLLREIPCDVDTIPHYPHEQLSINQAQSAFDAFCKENNEKFALSQQMFGGDVLSDVGPQGQTLWATLRPDGSRSSWHHTRQQAINDYMTHALTYMQNFDLYKFHSKGKGSGRFREVDEAYDWLCKKNPYNGHDHVLSYASRDLLSLMDERAAFLQPGLIVNRAHNHFCPGDENLDDGVTPIFPQVDSAVGRYYVNYFTVVSPVAYLQSRARVFWERMLNSQRVSEAQLTNFLTRLESDFPLMRESFARYFHDPNVQSQARWSRSRVATLANKMAAYTTCHVMAHPDEWNFPASVRLWAQLTPFSPLVDDTKPHNEQQGELRRSVPRGIYDRGLMTWVNRKTSEKMRNLAPVLESLRAKPFFPNPEDEEIRQLFNMSMGKDPVQQVEQGWMQLLCGEEVLRNASQRWLNFLYSPKKYWSGLSTYEQNHLAEFMAPIIRRGEDVAMSERSFDERLAEMSDTQRLELALEDLEKVLEKYPHMRKYGYVDPHIPFASMLLVNNKMPDMQQLDEPSYVGLGLHGGSNIQGCTVVPYGKFELDAQTAPEVGPALEMLSRLRMYPITRPVCKGGKITWNGVEYGGRHGKAPYRTENWEVIDNPLESLLRMRDKVEQIEQDEQEDTVEYFDYLYNAVLPSSHHDVFGNITVYRDRTKIMNICRLMPGEPFALYPTVTNPYVVQSVRGSYICQRQMADKPSMLADTMQPLEKFRPWGNQNRSEKRINEGRMMALRRNLNFAIRNTFEYNRPDTPLNVSPRELFMRLAIDTGFLDTLNNVQPRQMDYGSALTYNLINALYQYSCHPELTESRNALREVTQQLRDDEEDYQLVLRVLRESCRRLSRPDPIAPLFEWSDDEKSNHDKGHVWVNPDSQDGSTEEEVLLPVIKMHRVKDIKRLEIGEGVDFAPVDFDATKAPPMELMQYDYSEDATPADDGADIWTPRKMNTASAPQEEAANPPAPLMRPVDTHDKNIWGDLWKLKYPEKKRIAPPAGPRIEGIKPPRPRKPGFLDFGDDE